MTQNNNNNSPVSFVGRTISGLSYWISNLIDRLLYSKRFLALVSLVITLLIFASIVYSESLASQITQSTELTAEVEVVGDLDEYEIVNVPETVQVLVTGAAVDVRSAQNLENYSAVLDISDLGEGDHRVRLDRKGFSPLLKVIFQPEFVDINISRKVSLEFEVEPNYINNAQLEAQYILSNPVIENNVVTINTSQEKMSRISEVRALIDVAQKTESFNSVAKVVAYDQDGQAMDVDIQPSEVNVSVEVSSPSRQVPIVVTTVGDIPNNMAIENIEVDHPSVTIYGPEEVLNTISSIPATIYGPSLTDSEIELKHTLVAPEGVRTMDVESVNITITLGDKQTRDVEKSQIFRENNVNNYNVVMADDSDFVVDVILSGTQSRIDSINASDIKVFIDMTALRPGTQTVNLNVSGPDPLVNYELSQNEIEIIISEQGE